MPTYQIIEKNGGNVVYTYDADAPIEWVGYEFALFDHVQVAGTQPRPQTVYGGRLILTKREFLDLFTPDEQLAILGLFDANIYAKRAKLYLDAISEVHLNDVKTVELVNGLAQLGGIAQSRVQEILNG